MRTILHVAFFAILFLLAGPVECEENPLRARLSIDVENQSCLRGQAFASQGRYPAKCGGLGLGLEEGLAVERQETVKDDVVPITGTQRWTTKTEVSVHNLTDQTRSLTVRERVPVSESSDINVKLLRAPEEHSFDAETGFVDCPLELGPYQSMRLSLVQRVKASPRVEFLGPAGNR